MIVRECSCSLLPDRVRRYVCQRGAGNYLYTWYIGLTIIEFTKKRSSDIVVVSYAPSGICRCTVQSIFSQNVVPPSRNKPGYRVYRQGWSGTWIDGGTMTRKDPFSHATADARLDSYKVYLATDRPSGERNRGPCARPRPTQGALAYKIQ